MAFGGFDRNGGPAPMAEINMVPLIDVMLVLIVIFIITAPLLTHAVKIDLPRAASQASATKPDHVAIAIDGAGQRYWNNEAVGAAELHARLAAAAQRRPQPELHLRADARTPYQVLAEIMADAAQSGILRIGFVSDPSLAAPIRR